ncbi:hypothetical protein, partial [Xylanibacter rodentium]|uniref:hypothetical protein n=1 Tax=Xylanibacter rodentium TaxID=2736289 RepID=UPI002558305A
LLVMGVNLKAAKNRCSQKGDSGGGTENTFIVFQIHKIFLSLILPCFLGIEICDGGPVARPNGRYGNAGRPLRQVFHPENGCKESRETLIGFLFREKQNAFFSE